MDKNKDKIIDEFEIKYISLSEASKVSGYTPEHLNLMARKKKLRAKKIGRNWHTTHEWLELFLEEAAAKKNATETHEEISREEEEKVGSGIAEITKAEDAPGGVERADEDGEEDENEIVIPRSITFNWTKFFAFAFSAVIIFPLVFSATYFIKNSQKKFGLSLELQKLAGVPDFQIANENGYAPGEEISNIVSGKILGEETTAGTSEVPKATTMLASENYKASQVSFGGGSIALGSEENLGLEISDVKSDSFIVEKDKDAITKILVSWKTNKPAISEIEYAKNNGQDSKTLSEQNFGLSHSVVISGLDQKNSYIYKIKCRDKWANEVSTNYFGMVTASKPVSVFDMISKALGDTFGWAVKK